MRLDECFFGNADANTEYIRDPTIFSSAFFDKDRLLGRLLYGYEFLLIGRKGVGKSAFSARIRRLSALGELSALALPLSDFDYTVFQNTNPDVLVEGTKKYKHPWDFLFLLSLCEYLYYDMKFTEVDSLEKVIQTLQKNDFLSHKGNTQENILTLTGLKLSAGAGPINLEIDAKKSKKTYTYDEILIALKHRMQDAIMKCEFDKKLYVLIDGVDDLLRYSGEKIEILASLIRCANDLNNAYVENKKPIKFIVFIRDDVFRDIIDPDINKIKQDSSVRLEWSNNSQDLRQVVNLRFMHSGIHPERISGIWEDFFPQQVQNKPFWDFILEHSLYKPRDILRFFTFCKECYPYDSKITAQQIREPIKRYAQHYLVEEMKNELAGFLSDDLIALIPSVLRRISTKSVNFAEFSNLMRQQAQRTLGDEEIKSVMDCLYEGGYIGMVINVHNNAMRKWSVIFKHRTPGSRIDYSVKFVVHKGIRKGFGVV